MGPIAITLRPGLSAYLTPGLVPYRWRPRMGNSVLPATVFSRDGHVHVGGTAVSTPIWGPERLGPMDRYYQPIIWPLHDRRHPQRHADAGTFTDRPVLPQPRISTTAYPVGLYPARRFHPYQTTDRAGVPLRRAIVVWQPGQRIGYSARVKVWAAALLIVGAVLTIFGAVTGLWFGWIQAMTTSGQAAFPYAPFGL